MRRHFCILVSLLSGLSLACGAPEETLKESTAALSSNSRVHRDTYASEIGYTVVGVQSGASMVLETRELSPRCDPMMHVWDLTERRAAVSDDDSGPGLGSRVTIVNGTHRTKYYRVFIHAYSSGSRGTATLYRDGQSYRSIKVGGHRVGVPQANGIEYETALAPLGADRPMLLALDAGNRMITYDLYSGVGTASKISGIYHARSVVVGVLPGAKPGLTHFYVNDTLQDHDFDGLGQLLEAALGTCDNIADDACAYTFNPADTDRDGLSDHAEVFGVDGPRPQLLPKWGANPLHKDIFIEVDYWGQHQTDDTPPQSKGFAAQPFRPADAHYVQKRFDEAPSSHVQNPDGRPGVSVHLDIGLDPVDPKDATLYGDWGGSNATPGLSYQDGSAQQRRTIRHGMFRYALMSDNGAGQASGHRFSVGPGWNQDRAFTHELGHTLGIAHWGHNDWGPINNKLNYPSIMNYTDLGTYFSTGEHPAVLTPSALSEEDGLGALVDNAYLTQAPFHFDVVGQSVDWNRDGVINPGLVRGYLTWGGLAMDNVSPANVTREISQDEPGTATPDIARISGDLFVFWVDAAGLVRYRRAEQGISTAEIAQFEAEQILATQSVVSTISVTTLGDEAIVVYRTQTGLVRAVSVVDNGGSLQASGDVPLAFTANPDVEVAAMPVDASWFGAETAVFAYWVNGSGEIMTRRYIAAGRWAGTTWMLDGNGIRVESDFPPSVAVSPQQTCAALTNAAIHLALYCYDAANHRWDDVSATSMAKMPKEAVASKPSLAFHWFRKADGEPIAEDHGQFFLTWTAVHNGNKVAMGWTEANSTTFATYGRLRNTWTYPRQGTNAVLYEDIESGRMKSAYILQPNDQRPNPKLDFMDMADGTYDLTLKDGSDFEIMSWGICRHLDSTPGTTADSRCGPATPAGVE